jgi:hypothetical protein
MTVAGRGRAAMAATGVLLGGMLLDGPATAEPLGYRYDIMWGGFHAGELAITRDDQDTAYRSDMSIRTLGMFDTLLRLRFTAESVGARSTDTLSPGHYQTHFHNRREERLLRVEFDPGSGRGTTVLDEVLAVFAPPPDDEEAPPPPVPAELRSGASDPLTNILALGQRARAALSGGPTSFRTASFDGRRRYDFAVTVKGRQTVTIRDHTFDAILVTMVLKPLAGFKPRLQKMWGDAEYAVYLDPASGLPLRIQTDSFVAATVITMVEACHVVAEQCRGEAAP